MRKNIFNVVMGIIIVVMILPLFLTTISLAYEENKEIIEIENSEREEESKIEKNDTNTNTQVETETKEENIIEDNQQGEEVEKEEINNSSNFSIETEPEITETENNNLKTQARNIERIGTQEVEEGIYELYTYVNDTKVVDIQGSSKTDSANVDIYERENRNNQKFQLKLNSDGTYTFYALHSNKVLDVEGLGKNNGTNVCQYKFYGGDAQKWYLASCGNGYYNIISKVNGLYLDVTAGSGKDGTNIEVWQGNGANGQKFKLVKVVEKGTKTIEEGIYNINSKVAENRLLEVPNSATNNEVEIKTGTNKNLASQKFQITYNHDGTYTITVLHTGKAFDVRGGSGRNGTIVQQYTKHGQNSQKWIIQENADKTYSIIAKSNGLALDIEAGSTNVGAKVQTYQYHGGNSQKFTFELCKQEDGSRTVEDGTYRIISSVNVKKVWDIENSSIANGAKLQLADNTKNLSQKFDIEYIGEGYYKMKYQNSNKVLTVESKTPKVGSIIRQQEDENLDTQKWILKQYSEGVYGVVSKCGNLYITVQNENGLQLGTETDLTSQKFAFIQEEPEEGITQIKDGVYQITTKGNKVLDITGSSYNNGANVLIWDNTKGQQQKYDIRRIGDTQYYKIIAVHSGKSLDVEGGNTNPGANVIQYQYSGTSNQQWLLKDCGDGYYNIITKESGLCLDITAGQTQTAGANVELWYGNGADAQKFKLNPIHIINTDSYQIATKSNQFLDIEASSQQNNANLQVWSKNNANNQIFKVESMDDTYYKIIARHSSKVLTVAENGNVVQSDDITSDEQQWSMETVGNGYYKIKSKATGDYLHIDGKNVKVTTAMNTENQMFRFDTLLQRRGIDVSEHNGLINWEYVRRSGVEFAIIRVGYRGYRTGAFAEDKYFRRNIEGAKKAGLKVGIYFFTQAVNEAEAREEANWTVNKIKEAGYVNQIDYPIIIDTELSGGNPPGRADGLDVGTRTSVCKAFCETIKANGYRAMVYASRNWFYNQLDVNQLNPYEIWVAHYTNSPTKLTDYKYHYEIWQYTSSGQIMGIQSRVDLNISYQSY